MHIEKQSPEPWVRIEKFVALLRQVAAAAGLEHEARIKELLRDTASQALSTKTIHFDLDDSARLRNDPVLPLALHKG